jgi:hypothetical protein
MEFGHVELFVSAVGLVLIFEGIPYFLYPEGMKRMAGFMAQTDSKALRIGGLALMLAGIGILYVFKGN